MNTDPTDDTYYRSACGTRWLSLRVCMIHERECPTCQRMLRTLSEAGGEVPKLNNESETVP